MMRRIATSQSGTSRGLPRRPRPALPEAPPPAPAGVGWRSQVAWGLAGLGVFVGLIWLVWPVFSMLAAASALAYMLDPIVDRFEARGKSREAGIATVFALAFIALVMLVLILVPAVATQFADLAVNAPRYVEKAEGMLAPASAWADERLGVHLPVDWSELKTSMPGWLQQLSPDARKTITGFLQGLFQSGFGFVLGVFNLALLPVFTFFLLRDWDKMIAMARALVPPVWRPVALRVASQVDERLAGFVQGQITVALLLAVLYSVGLWLAGIDLAFTVGILAGLLFVIPYLGTIVGIVLATLLSLVKYGVDVHLLWVALAFGIPQALEGWVITPKIMGDKVGLHPMVVMVALLVGGSLLGIWGMLLAIPVAAVLDVVGREGLDTYRRSRLFLENPG